MALAALAVRLVFQGALGPNVPYAMFYPAVVAAAVTGGLYGGILAMALSLVFVHRLISPLYSEAQWIGLAIFLVTNSFIVGMAELLYRARGRLASAERTRQHKLLPREFTEQTPSEPPPSTG